ncbi:hypothetical protein DICVIV_11063 [Dictyocaulus viviparus]|uniref:Uncharacterized protein n=1 Tax=Dictyocaulus viviparus TaxID=29172 RepID=A0A0D8XE62_DICVI|nr:hypothetical protein DICVIV_11063 [Dictyocaulus viviparus]
MRIPILNGIQKAAHSLILISSCGIRSAPRTMPSIMGSSFEAEMPDKLFSSIELEYRGHDPEVLKSYTKFLEISWGMVRNLTGSTASTFLEYIQRNIPEGVGMRVGYTEIQPLPTTISLTEKITSISQMVVWSDNELDEITDEFLSMMLSEQVFLDRWAVDVEEEVAQMNKDSNGNSPVHRVTKCDDTIVSIFEELTHGLDASSQSFLSSVDFMTWHCEPEHNRDASLLFAVRLQVDRIESKKVDRNRLGASARRLLQLVRLFTTRISSSFQISNTSAFATSLCDMLYTFCDSALNIVNVCEQRTVSGLRRAVDDFNEIVVEKLSKSAFETQCSWRNTVKSKQKPFSTPQPTRLRQPLIQIQHRSPGYLLPIDLLKKRRKQYQSCHSFCTRRPVLPSTPLTSKKISSKIRTFGQAERKLDHLADGNRESMNITEDQNDSTIRLARKISKEVIKDLKKRYGNSDLAVLARKISKEVIKDLKKRYGNSDLAVLGI